MRVRISAVLLSFALAGSAHALTVEVEAPEALQSLLARHLEVARAARLEENLAEEEIERLVRASESGARALLATEGYFSPRVSILRAGDVLRVVVDPGSRTTVGSVRIDFAGGLDADSRLARRIEEDFRLKPGMPFRQADWDAAKAAVLAPLLAGRHPGARLAVSEARIDPAAARADLSLTLDAGPAYRFGVPRITGASRYPAEIAARLAPMRPGEPVSQAALIDYQARLETSGYYSQANVRILPDPAQAEAVPIEVEVVERPEKRLSLGIGLTTDTGVRAQAEWLSRSIDGQGLRLRLDTRLETTSQRAGAELTWPRDSRGRVYSLGIQPRREDLRGQRTETLALTGRATRERGNIETALALQFQNEQQRIGSAVDTRNRALTANYTWTQRDVGRGFYPRRGRVTTLQVGGAAEALLSDTSFLRLYGRHTQYFGLGAQTRLIVRGELGSVLAESRAGIPTDFLFRAGGDNSVRGYAFQSLGRSLEGGVASVRYLATGSLEVEHFFTRDWGAAVFVDAGDAADSPAALDPVFGLGIGARWRSPVGPVNLDLAYGEAVGELRLHFSLGVSF